MNLRIEPIAPAHNEAALALIFAVAFESFAREGESFAAWKARVTASWLASDMEDLSVHYPHNGGAFWVLLDGESVVGTGAVRRMDDQICELKRMYLLPRARGLGWGRRMAQTAIEWARDAGYDRMRLDTTDDLTAATALYQSLGFREIPRYKPIGGDLCFELKL